MISKNVCDKCEFLFVNKNNRYCALKNININDVGGFDEESLEYRLLKLIRLNKDIPKKCPYYLEHLLVEQRNM